MCDLSDLSSVHDAADAFVKSETRVDVLLACASIMASPAGLTHDRYEVQFGTNHLGHAVLIKKLLPLLERTPDSRVIIVTTLGNRGASGILFADMRGTQKSWLLGS